MYGQPDFATRIPNSGAVTQSSMNNPRAIAFDPAGNLWLADTGNHRVLRISSQDLKYPNPQADVVVGQPDFVSGSPNRGGDIGACGFDTPTGLAFDQQGNLYVSDTNNHRILKFAAPVGTATSATAVFGQPNFGVRINAPQPSAFSLIGPEGLAVDNAGTLYVAAQMTTA